MLPHYTTTYPPVLTNIHQLRGGDQLSISVTARELAPELFPVLCVKLNTANPDSHNISSSRNVDRWISINENQVSSRSLYNHASVM